MRTKYDPQIESQLADALDYIKQNPGAKVATVAKEFGLNRGQLQSRVNGYAALNKESSYNTKLSAEEEKAVCRYIDRLDAINLSVRREFVVKAANTVLSKKAGKHTTP